MEKTQIQVLLIEDTPSDALLLREVLENDKLTVFVLTTVERLNSAIKLLSERPFDIILLDLSLPDSQGLETFTRIHQAVPSIPKVILSGFTDEDFAMQAVQAGAQDYLVKGTAGFSSATRAIQYAIERQRSQTALQLSETRYHRVLDVMMEGCQILSFDWIYLYINDAAEIHNRRSKDELLGRKFMDMWPGIEATELFAEIQHCMEKRGVVQMETEFTFPDGTAGWFSLSIQPVPEGVFILSTDITESKHARDALRASEERFRAMIEHGSDDISLLSAEGNLLWESPAVIRNLGYPENAFVGRNIFELVHPDDVVWANALYAKLVQTPGDRQDGIFRLRHFDGTWRWVEAVITNMLDTPSVRAIVANYHDITERKQAEAKLYASETRYRLATLATKDVIWEWVPSTGQLIWTENAENVFGYTSEDIGSNYSWWEDHIHPEDRERVILKMNQDLEDSVSVWSDEYRFLLKDGSHAYVDDHAHIERGPNGNAIRLIGAISDVTERIRSEIEIQQKSNDLGVINAINEAVIRGESLNVIMNRLAKELKRIFSSEGSAIYMLSPDGQSLTMQQYFLSPEINRGIEKLIGNTIPLVQIPIKTGGFFQRVLHAGHGTITSDPEEIQNWMGEFVETAFLPPMAQGAIRKLIPQICKLLNFKSIIVVPLISNENIIGLLDVSSANLFTDDDLQRIENISRQLTAAILRQQANEKIQRSEEFLQSVQNALSANIAILDESGIIVRVNSAWRKFGEQNGLVHPEYAIGLNYLDICDSATGPYAEEAPLVAKAIREVIAGHRREASIEYSCHSPEEKRWFLLRITKFEDGDQIWVVLAHENITERKQAEEALRESEVLYRQAIEAAGAVPYRESYSDKGTSIKYEFIGEGIRQITGYGPEEFSGQLWDELAEEATLVEDLTGYTIDEGIQRVRSGENPIWKCEYRIRDLSGNIHWVFEAAVELRDEHGVSHGSIGTFQDITARKQAEIALRESEQRYRALFEDMPVAIWEEDFSEIKKYLDSLTGQGITDFQAYFESNPDAALECANKIKILDVNNTAVKMFRGESREQLLSIAEQELSKGEREHLVEFITDIAEGKTSDHWEGGDETFTGDPIEISLSWSVVPGYENDYSKVIVTTTDITERKQAEEKLRESEARFASIFHTNPTRVSITSFADGRFLDVNESFLESSGYSRQEVIGHTSDSLNDWVNPQDRVRLRTQLEEQGSVQNFETQLHQKSGNILDILISAELIELFGQLCILSVGLDITERKRDEQKLRESKERFEQLANNIEEAFWITTTKTGEEVYLSPATEKIWGKSMSALMKPNAFLEYVHQEDRQAVEAALDKQSQGEKTALEYRILHPDGSVRWIWDRAFPVFDAAGNVIRSAGIAADITERKQSESALARHLTELEALYENGLAVGRLLNQNEIGERIISTFARHLSWHHVAIRLRRPESDELELIAFNQPGLSDEERTEIEHHFNSMISRVGQGLSGWVVSIGESIRVGDVRSHAQYVDTHPGIQSGLYMPLKIGERVIGVISVESEAPNAFSEQDERLLATLANQAAIAFENARLYQSAQQELQERKRAETALQTSETHYRELADSITDIFFELDHDLRYSHWNKASEILTGVIAKDAIGKSMYEIFGESDEQVRIEKIYKDVLVNQRSRTFETPFIVNRQQRAFEVNAYPSTRGVSVVAKDVTERKRSETIMQKRFELMEYAAQHSLEEVMQKMTDEVCNLTGSTIAFFDIMEADQTSPGLRMWPTNTLNLFTVAASEGGHRSVEQARVWAEALRQRRAIIQNDYESPPTGHAPIVREMVVPIIRNEKILAVIGIANKTEEYTRQDLEIAGRFADYAWDITERKQMEVTLADERNQLAERVDERTADLSRANSNLARALRVKDEFLANMSHELRTPLNAILGLSESLGEQTAGPLNEKQMRYITTVSESGHHLLSLINDILDLAKIEAGQITLDVNKVDIHSVCDASLRLIKQLARKKNQDIAVEIENDLGLMWADERRLKQMLVNLLSNAVKFTPDGGKLGLEVHGDRDANTVTFTIWDTGIGIKETDLSRLFQPFVQLDSGLARESSGTGLGLALVSQMARMHGGSTSVVSQPGAGSRFSIMLPWEPALFVDTVERLKSTGKFRPIKFNKGQKPTILLIEDTEEVIMMLSDYLELNGFKTVIARDGVEGVTQAQLTHPDLILMDIQMPLMDGFEATKKLRSESEFKHTPIIALTALAMQNDRERCLAAGMDEYITKPVHLRTLIKVIETFLSGEKEAKSQ